MVQAAGVYREWSPELLYSLFSLLKIFTTTIQFYFPQNMKLIPSYYSSACYPSISIFVEAMYLFLYTYTYLFT